MNGNAITSTSMADVNDLAGSSERARDKITWWQQEYPEEMCAWVLRFRHEALYRLTLEDFQRAVAAGSHALGTIRKEESLAIVEDAHPPYALQYLFHNLLEHRGLPTWDYFHNRMRKDSGLAQRWYTIVWERCMAQNVPDIKAQRAIQWRLGKFWQSTMREIHLMVTLRERYGIHVKYHMLADVLLRTDGWIDRKLYCVRVRNEFEQRKMKTATLFPSPPYSIHMIAQPHKGSGRLWIIEEDEIGKTADFLK